MPKKTNLDLKEIDSNLKRLNKIDKINEIDKTKKVVLIVFIQ